MSDLDQRQLSPVQPRAMPPLAFDGTTPGRAYELGEILTDTDERKRMLRLLFYSDGVTEARGANGVFFGEERLIDMTERVHLDRLPAPETLRRLTAAVLTHQHGELQDDLTPAAVGVVGSRRP